MNTEKERRAIEYLKSFEPQDEPYYLCYSGGKDSDCIRILAELAGVKHELHHNLTTVDAPETMRYIRSIPGVIIDRPQLTMVQLIVKKKFPPTRIQRYCCKHLKERGGKGRLKIMGVRWGESRNRKENHGRVTVIGKSKTMQKLAGEYNANFRLTVRGGGAKRRQFGKQKICRALLQDNLNYGKPDSRLDGRRCMGIFAPLRVSVKSTLSMRRKENWLYRLPVARICRTERGF